MEDRKKLKKHIEIVKLEPKFPIILPSFKFYCEELVKKGIKSNLIIDFNTGNEFSNSNQLQLNLFEHEEIKSLLQGESNPISISVGGIRYFVQYTSPNMASGSSSSGEQSTILIRRTNSLLIIGVYNSLVQDILSDYVEEVVDLLIKNNKYEELISNLIND